MTTSVKIDDIRHLSDKWTLAGDSMLLKYLEESSDRLANRVETTIQQVNEAIASVSRATIQFDNMHGQFFSLSAKQFIENRIYDEDVSIPVKSNQSANKMPTKSRSQCESEMLSSITNAISLGCRLMDSHFKRIEIKAQDLDEDDDPTFRPQPIYEPLDPYLVHPLPLIVGSQQFKSSKFAGLDDENDGQHLRVSTEIDDLMVDVTIGKQSPMAMTPSPIAINTPESVEPSDHSGLFMHSSGGSDDLFVERRRQNAQQAIPPSQTAIQIVADPRPPSEIDDSDSEDIFYTVAPVISTISNERSIQPVHKTPIGMLESIQKDPLFTPEDDDDDDLFAPKKHQPFRPKNTVAFIAESSLLESVSSTENPPSTITVSTENPKPAPLPRAKQANSSKMDENRGKYDQSKGGADIFCKKIDNNAHIFAKKVDDDDEFTENADKLVKNIANANTLTPNLVKCKPIHSQSAPSTLPNTVTSIFDDDSDDEDIFVFSAKYPVKEQIPQKSSPKDTIERAQINVKTVQQSKKVEESAKYSSLFDDDSDSDLDIFK